MNNQQKLLIVICLTLIPIFLYGLNHLLRKGGAVKGEAVATQLTNPLLTAEVTITTIPTITPIPTDHTIPTAIHADLTLTSDQTDWEQFDKEMKQSAEELKQSKEELDRLFGPQSSGTLDSTPAPTPTPIPTPTPTLTFAPTSTPTPTLTFSYADLHCPKVIKIEDNLGNSSVTTSLNGTFKKGSIDLLTVKITATDPRNLPLNYQYSYSGVTGHNPYLGNWSTNNTYNVDVTNAYIGSNRVLFAAIDNQDGYGCSGAYYDTSIQFNYDITL